MHDVLPEQESVQAISPSQRFWMDRLAAGAERSNGRAFASMRGDTRCQQTYQDNPLFLEMWESNEKIPDVSAVLEFEGKI